MKRRRIFNSAIVAAIIAGVATIIAAFIPKLLEKTPPIQQIIEKSPGLTKPEPDIIPSTKVPEIKPTEIEEKEKRLNELKGLISTGVTTHRSKPNIALIIESKKTESGVSPENTLYNLLKSERMNIILNIFKEEHFKSKGFFKEIYEGNTELLTQAHALSKIDHLILGRLDYSFSKRSAIDDLISCNISFSYKIVGKKGNIFKSDSINVIGPGFSKDAALERGLEMLAEKYADRILGSLL